MTEKAPVFEKIIKDYLLQVAGLEARGHIGSALGIAVTNGGFTIPFFNRTYTIATDWIVDVDGKAATHAVSVVLCKYLLLCPDRPSDDFSLVTYKDFRDAAPYAGAFRKSVEQAIARRFAGALPELEKRCLELGGQPFDTEVSCQLAFKFQALPSVPVFLLFNDADEDFPAQATLLLRKNAASYLDMECLAMIGGTLAHRLQEKSNIK